MLKLATFRRARETVLKIFALGGAQAYFFLQKVRR